MKKAAIILVFILLATSYIPNVLAENNSSSGKVIVNYYLDGVIFDQDQLIITKSKTVHPKIIPEYDCLSSEVYVTLDEKTGQCSPSIISFEYKKHSKKYDSGEITIEYCLDGVIFDQDQLIITKSKTVHPKIIPEYDCLSSGVYVTFDEKTGQCSPSIISFEYKIRPKEYDSGEITIEYYLDGVLSETKHFTISNSQQITPKSISNYECLSSGIYVTFDKTTGECTPSIISFKYSKQKYESGEIMIYYYLDGALSETEQRTIKYSQRINPKKISGYDCSSSGININFDKKTGQCNPSTIQFYYQTARKKGPGDSYDMGKPSIGSRVFSSGDMNMIVFWVQTQMKATGRWYQGDNWDCTGNLGDHTISEISSFMKYRGYSGHSGNIDQNVIDELASYLGDKIVPVYIGGMYDHMRSIMSGDSIGTMKEIVSNLRDMIPHETTGARWIQVCLKKLGYYYSNIDGKYGEGTEQAVKRFQNDYGWQQRDYVSLGVARAILEAYYSSGGNLNNLPEQKPEGI